MPHLDQSLVKQLLQQKLNGLRKAARERLRAETRQNWLGPPAGLQAHFDGIALPEATDAMRQAAIETVWRAARRARIPLFPIGELDQYEGHWVQDEVTGDEGFLDEHEDLVWVQFQGRRSL